MCPDVDVESCDFWKFKSDADHWQSVIDNYEQLIVIPEAQGLGVVDFSILPNVTWVPGFSFCGFHPDLSYVAHGNTAVKSPMDDYHSIIIFAAFNKGLSESETHRLFCANFYDKLGFFSIWESEKKALFESFDSVGLNIRANFVQWMRSGCFMYTTNHPRINAIYDVANLVAVKIKKREIINCGIIPHDNLTVAPIFPVYPEIAERYGLSPGSYFFKSFFSYRVFDLDEFIEGSFKVYRNYNSGDLRAGNPFYNNAIKLITEGV